MGRIRTKDALFGLAVAVLVAIVAASPAGDVLRGVTLDVLTALRWRAFGQQHDPASSPTVVVAIDEETHHTPPFAGTPQVTWTRDIGRVITALVEADAKVIGLDIIFPNSIEQSQVMFGDESLGSRVRGFDRDFLRALALPARAEKLLLGQVQHSSQPIAPSQGQRVAVGGQRNIRFLNYYNDPDDIVRRLPLTFPLDGVAQPSMAVELAARALGARPELRPNGGMTLAGYAIPSRVPNTMAINFDGGADDIPTYSLADLHACVDKGDKDFFRRQFADKIVLVGTVLDVEDRKITSKRLSTAPEGARATRCVLPPPSTGKFARDSISGVYVHATAVNNLIRRNAVIETGPLGSGMATLVLAALAIVAGFALAPVGAVLTYGGMALVWTGAATWMFQRAFALPLLEPLLMGLIALAATVGYRFIISDKDKRLLRRSFALYLAPAVIDKMMNANRLPALGGELREVTVFFSDVAGFSSFAEKMTPSALVALMTEYLSAMTDIIEAHNGFVDKYIGDAIVAVFGAPLDDPDHARHAVEAAIACRARLAELNETATSFAGHKLGQRIGLNSGAALVGNIGSQRRFNYTVMGDTVNLASRLEGANKYFATGIMASDTTVGRAGRGFVWRELDAIRVKGRGEPVKIYEPVAVSGQETSADLARIKAYAEGLARWRERKFSEAAAAFARAADSDPPSAEFLERAQELATNPPDADWEPVNTLEDK
jgi:adenylate cyclase